MWPSQSQTGILLLWISCAFTYYSAICIWGLKAQSNQTDQQKLLSFKRQVVDPSGMLSMWFEKEDCCGWAGVECDDLTHRVTKLSLPCPFLHYTTDCLSGSLPKEISNLKQLESLDLSNNFFNSEIPQSMSQLSFLGYLNLSFNKFTGQIPQIAQLQRFDALCYIGNPELWGAPLTTNCKPEEKPNILAHIENEDDEEFFSWFYIGMGVGFAMGFWAICASLFFNRTWRHAFFKFFDELKSQLYVFVVIKMNIFG